MREKKETLIITFPTTTEAMKTSKYCSEQGLSGRLIPVPREISASCGLAWKAEPAEQDTLPEVLLKAGIRWEQARVLLI